MGSEQPRQLPLLAVAGRRTSACRGFDSARRRGGLWAMFKAGSRGEGCSFGRLSNDVPSWIAGSMGDSGALGLGKPGDKISGIGSARFGRV